MWKRPSSEIRNAVGRIALPMPLETLLYRGINADGADGAHERLVYAWEVLVQIAATSTWAACRHLGLRSAALDEVKPKLARPLFGHWLELLRASRALLETRTDGAAVAMRPLLDGLETRYTSDERLARFAERLQSLPKRKIKINGRTLGALLDAVPAYRNETRGHGEPDTAFREQSIDTVLDGLLAFCEKARPTGENHLVIVTAIERDSGGHRLVLVIDPTRHPAALRSDRRHRPLRPPPTSALTPVVDVSEPRDAPSRSVAWLDSRSLRAGGQAVPP